MTFACACALLLLTAFTAAVPPPARADDNGVWSRLLPGASDVRALVVDPGRGRIIALGDGDAGVWALAPDGLEWTELPSDGGGPDRLARIAAFLEVLAGPRIRDRTSVAQSHRRTPLARDPDADGRRGDGGGVRRPGSPGARAPDRAADAGSDALRPRRDERTRRGPLLRPPAPGWLHRPGGSA